MNQLYLYLFILTLTLWYKDKNLLEKFINTCLWIFGILYGKLVSSDFYKKITQSNKNNSSQHRVYILDNTKTKLLPLEPSTTQTILQSDSEKYYVIVDLQPENTKKILLFDNKEILIAKFNDLETLTRLDKEKFNNILEVIECDTNKEITSLFTKYISNEGFFENITNYNLKVQDLYDFDLNTFLTKSKITITNMNLDSKDYNLTDTLK